MYEGPEHRKHFRVPKHFGLLFYYKNAPSNKIGGILIKNISKGGLCFRVSKPIQEGAELVFEINVPYIAPEKLIVFGKIASCNEISPRLLYELRVIFTSNDVHALEVLDIIEKRNLKGQ